MNNHKKSPQKISVPNSRKLRFKILSLVGGVPKMEIMIFDKICYKFHILFKQMLIKSGVVGFLIISV